uniref:ATP synthase protein I n=1 Tax=uncultured prokaryote TaxID=198431 RepID=H5SPA2_9ZZZZ|nr:ATP synthase protein I [uncultured prokaryote]
MKNRRRPFWQMALIMASAGLEMGASVAAGLIIGYYLDKYFNIFPWLTVTGIILGFIAGFNTLIRYLLKLQRRSREGDGD